MKLRTEITLLKQSHLIDYSSKIVLFGSCFAENISAKLDFYRFSYLLNPYGILFHPIAIEKSLKDISDQKIYTPKDLYFNNDLWQSFNHHSVFSSTSQEEVLNNINQSNQLAYTFLKEATHIVVSLGTAWVYEFLESQELVANCHKIPQKKFTKRLLSLEEVEESLQHQIDLIQQFNPNASILFTVSPVRHLSNGMAENSQSKALLLTAIHRVINQKESFYFPSYEIMMDDLRDYRFYKSDLIHPNELAVDYIWEHFKNSWIDKNAYPTMELVADIQKGLQHRPFNKNSPKHQEFVTQLQLKMEELNKKYNIQF